MNCPSRSSRSVRAGGERLPRLQEPDFPFRAAARSQTYLDLQLSSRHVELCSECPRPAKMRHFLPHLRSAQQDARYGFGVADPRLTFSSSEIPPPKFHECG